MDYQFPCPFCLTLNDINNIQCTHCHKELTRAINVKYASIPAETVALQERYVAAQAELVSRGLEPEGGQFEFWVLSEGKAVINMDFAFLWEWLMHSGKDYQAYKRLVVQGDRPRKPFANDKMRSSVESLMFGSHEDIIYASFTLDEKGLSSYGGISVVIATNTIDKVTSLLDENSYHFIKRITAGGWFIDEPFPPGHFATWPERNKLVLAKCHHGIQSGITLAQSAALIMSPASNKPEDEFIELYIYGKINKSMVEKITFPVDLRNSLSDDQRDQYDELKTHYIVDEY